MATAPLFPLSVLNKKIAFSTIVQYAGKAVQLVFASVSIKLITNFLGQESYGVYGAIVEYVLFFSTVANLGIFGNVIRLMSEKPDDSQLFFDSLVLRAVTGLFFFILAVLYAFLSGSGFVFAFGTAIFCSALFFEMVTSVCDGMLQANYMMGRANIALIAGRIVNLTLLFLVVRFSGQMSSMANWPAFAQTLVFLATLLGSFVTMVLSIIFVSKKITFTWKVRSKVMVDILRISLPFGIINIINNLYFRFLPDYFANNMLDSKHFASFNVLFRICQVISLSSTFLMLSALPGLTEYIEGHQLEKATRLFNSLKKILLGGGALMVVVGTLVGPFAVSILTHDKYNLPEFWFVLPVMLVLAAISFGYDLVLVSLFAARKEIWFLKREFIALAISAVFFGSQYLITDMTLRMVLILMGAIAGESFMVFAGLRGMRSVLTKQ